MNKENKKILIVDDDAKNVFALSLVLRSRGYTSVTAGSGVEALAILADRKDIGIVLTDMMMPDMDGYTVIPKIKIDEKTSGIPVIAVTAQAMTGDRERCLEAGADGYLSKPINVDALMQLLNEYLK